MNHTYKVLKTLQVKAGSSEEMNLETLEKGGYYHIYNRGINSTAIFFTDENMRFFLKQMDKYLSGKISVYAYCLMQNHFHWVVRVDHEPSEVTQAFSNFFNSYAKAFNKQNNRTGSLFEKHFKRVSIKDEDYLRNVITYTHLNPWHHLNIDFETYEFSSYQSFLNKNELLHREVVELFSDRENFIYYHKSRKDFLNEKYMLE